MRYLLVLISILFIGCARPKFDINKVDFPTEKQQKVLPLKYYNKSNMKSESSDKIMKNVLMDGNEFLGYYYVYHSYNKREEKVFIYDVLAFEDIVKIVLSVLGVPESRVFYNLDARVYLFDSHGDIVGIYEETNDFFKYKGLYYGNSTPVKDMSNSYKKMYKDIVDNIASDKERVNELLEFAGPLKDDQTAKVYTEVYRLVNK